MNTAHDWMPQLLADARRHRIFKYGQNWYGDCGLCSRAVWNPRWSATLGLLTLHVQEHQPLTTVSSSS